MFVTKQILIIEDDQALVDLVRIHLHQLPASLTATSSGREGLDWLAGNPVDLCILDVMMPGMNGIEICQRIPATRYPNAYSDADGQI